MKNFPIYFVIFIFLAGFLAYYLWGFGRPSAAKYGRVEIGKNVFRAEIADDANSRMRGLSDREPFEEDEGMLFIFDEPSIQSFWMKDMKFSIDIIWIEGGRVIAIEKNIEPEPGKSVFSLKTYSPPQPVGRALEVLAGTSDKLGIRAGDEVRIDI